MNGTTERNDFTGTRDRRRYCRRSTDRPAPEPRDEHARCEEIGCDEPVWPGRRFCVWHPKLQLVARVE